MSRGGRSETLAVATPPSSFHVIGRRAANPGSKRYELGLYRITDIASFLMVPE